MATELFIAKSQDLQDGEKVLVSYGDTEIAVYRFKGRLYAYRNLCAHQGGPACEGIVIAKVQELLGEDRTYQGMVFVEDEPHIVCPWHGWEYELKTGVNAADSRFSLKAYDAIERDGEIYVLA